MLLMLIGMLKTDQLEYGFNVDKEKAALMGVATAQVAQLMHIALSGQEVSTLNQEKENDQVGISLQLAEHERSSLEDLKKINVLSQHGQMITVGDIVNVDEEVRGKSIYRKNQKRVIYVYCGYCG